MTYQLTSFPTSVLIITNLPLKSMSRYFSVSHVSSLFSLVSCSRRNIPKTCQQLCLVMRHNKRVQGFMLHCNEMKMVRHLCQPTNGVKVLYKTNF